MRYGSTRWHLPAGNTPCRNPGHKPSDDAWIASDNFGTLRPHAMEDWLSHVQNEGRYTHVPRPFILSGQQALDTMLEHTPGWNENPRERPLHRIALAHALSEPNDARTGITRRIAILGRFATDLRDCGMTIPGKNLERWQTRMYANLEHGKEDEVWNEIEQMRQLRPTERVSRTRQAEDRRMRYEAGTMTNMGDPPPQRLNPGHIER